MGIRLHATTLDAETLGLYSPEEDRIYFDLRLTPNERRTTIAHELGHAYYGHTATNPARERQADTYAAELLIDPQEYAMLERISCDRDFLADELRVTVDLIDHYRGHCLQRVGHRTYSRHPHRSRLTNPLAKKLAHA